MRESRDSVRFLINTQVQSHTLLRRGFGTSVPFIYICKRNHNILNWLWNYPFLCWFWGYDALHVWKIDYWKAKGIPLVVKVCTKPTIQDLNVKIQVGINSCHNSLWFSYALIQWKYSQYKNFLKYLKGSHSGVWKYLIWLFSLFFGSANRECYVVTIFDMPDFTDLYQSHVPSPCLYMHKFHLQV